MSAVTVNASARPAAKVTGRSTMFAKRCETRKLAAQAATRSVQARAITEVTAESTDANSALYEEFKKLLVDYEFAYKVGDRVSGKVFHCDAKGAWVDIGAKAAALCPSAEASLADVRNVRPPPRSDAIPTAPASSPSRAAPRGLPPVARASAASRATAFERAHFLTRAPTRVRPNAREWINDKRERRRDVSPPASRPTVTLTRPIPPPPAPPLATQAAAVFDIGEEYEFEIIRDDDGDGSLTLSVRKIQVRFRATFSRAPRPKKRPKLP